MSGGAMMTLFDVAAQLCKGMSGDEDINVNSIIEDKMLLLKMICATRCLRMDEANCEYNWTPVHCAARFGNIIVLQIMLRDNLGVPADIRDDCRRTPLYYASAYGHMETVKLLLSVGARKNCPDRDGWTALHAAARNGHTEVVRYLVKQGAVITSRDKRGWSAFHKSVWSGNLLTMHTFLSLSKGRCVNATSNAGTTALHLAAAQNNHRVVNLLLNNGANVNASNTEGHTPLFLACHYGCESTVIKLLDADAVPGKKDLSGWTAMHAASDCGNVSIVKLLHKKDGNPYSRNSEGWTPLHLAAYNGRLELVQWYMDMGTDGTLVTSGGSTILHLAAQQGHVNVVQALLKHPTIYVNAKTDEGRTPLFLAVLGGHKDVVEVLLKGGAHINESENKGWSPMHIASLKQNATLSKLLLFKGGNVFHLISSVFTLIKRTLMLDYNKEKEDLIPHHDLNLPYLTNYTQNHPSLITPHSPGHGKKFKYPN